MYSVDSVFRCSNCCFYTVSGAVANMGSTRFAFNETHVAFNFTMMEAKRFDRGVFIPGMVAYVEPCYEANYIGRALYLPSSASYKVAVPTLAMITSSLLLSLF